MGGVGFRESITRIRWTIIVIVWVWSDQATDRATDRGGGAIHRFSATNYYPDTKRFVAVCRGWLKDPLLPRSEAKGKYLCNVRNLHKHDALRKNKYVYMVYFFFGGGGGVKKSIFYVCLVNMGG